VNRDGKTDAVKELTEAACICCLAGKFAGGYGGVSHDAAAGGDVVGYARLGAYLCAVAHCDMPGDAHLSAYHAVVADVCAAGDSGLGGHYGMLAHGDVVRHLYQVVQLGAAAYTGGAHGGAVYGGVGAYLDVIAYFDDAHLRYFVVDSVAVGCKAEAVGTYDDAGMDDAACADMASGVYAASGIEHGVFAYDGAVAYVHLGVYLGAASYLGVFADVCKGADVCFIGYVNALGYIAGLLDAAGMLCHSGGGHFHQFGDCAVGVGHAYHGGMYGVFGYEVVGHEHYG